MIGTADSLFDPLPMGAMTLRDYQDAAVAAAVAEFAAGRRSTYVVLPTGTGKTPIFCELARRFADRGRVMIVTHLDTLNRQAGEKVRETLGVEPEYEKADQWATPDGKIVVASRQTLMSRWGEKKRLHRFGPEDFALIIFDECHLAITDSNIEIARWFCTGNPGCRVFGVTATPDRADKEKLGVLFESCAYSLELRAAIEGGWLAPIIPKIAPTLGIDWAKISTDRGDLRESDLAEEMDENDGAALHKLASATIEHACGLDEGALKPLLEIEGDDEKAKVAVRRDRLAALVEGKKRLKTLVFTVRVRHADLLRQIFDRWIPDSARVVVGDTPEDERLRTFRDFHGGAFQFLIGVGALTTGFDEPDVELVVIGRPTKSRALYAQMVGRGTRPASSIAHALGRLPAPADRRRMIAESPKPAIRVLDVTCNSRKHKLVTPFHLLAEGVEQTVLDRAAEIARDEDADVLDAVEKAKQRLDEEEKERKRVVAEKAREREVAKLEEERRRQKIVGAATYTTESVDLFDVYDVGADTDRRKASPSEPSERQKKFLVALWCAADPSKDPGQARAVAEQSVRGKVSSMISTYKAKVDEQGLKPNWQAVDAAWDGRRYTPAPPATPAPARPARPAPVQRVRVEI
jgi:superfamily II DNA or RNA helicase